MRETLFDYCKRTGELELLRQWNSERNGALTPETVSYGSKKKVSCPLPMPSPPSIPSSKR